MEAPRDFTRSIDFTLDERSAGGDGLTFSGEAVVFNQATRIDSWEGRFDEIIKPGALTKTLQERTPVLMFDHGKHPVVGPMPLGTFTQLREDAHGLHVEARLHDNWMTQPVRDAISSRAITGMSFRFKVVDGKEKWTKRDGDVPLREISELMMPELGPVVFPAYAGTSASVRSLFSQLTDEDRAAIAYELREIFSTRHDEAGTSTSPFEPLNQPEPPPESTPVTQDEAAFREEQELWLTHTIGVLS